MSGAQGNQVFGHGAAYIFSDWTEFWFAYKVAYNGPGLVDRNEIQNPSYTSGCHNLLKWGIIKHSKRVDKTRFLFLEVILAGVFVAIPAVWWHTTTTRISSAAKANNIVAAHLQFLAWDSSALLVKAFDSISFQKFHKKSIISAHEISLQSEISLHRLRHGHVQYCDQHLGRCGLNICSFDGLDVLQVFMTDCSLERTFLAQWLLVTSAQR